ncbi:MAG: class II SORL domain-containing protein [Patescibacteria group bacterium]|nr:class II SORL domain-containing protein [Patescibacteria group bacterium]
MNGEPKKHQPVIILMNKMQVKIQVGEIIHPMIEGHYITWIELEKNGSIINHKETKPGETPIVVFNCPWRANDLLIARTHCNLHGQWEANLRVPY